MHQVVGNSAVLWVGCTKEYVKVSRRRQTLNRASTSPTLRNVIYSRKWQQRHFIFGGKMPLSGEAIRLMNYVDDVTTTLRRILALAPTLTVEERTRLSEYLRNADPNAEKVMAALSVKSSGTV